MDSLEKRRYSLYNRILDFNCYIRTYIVNTIPNIHRDIRIHLLDECYNLAKNMFYATYNKGNIRMKYIIELKVNMSLIDMFLINIKDFKCVRNNKINTAISKLTEIKNIIYGWGFNEEERKQKHI